MKFPSKVNGQILMYHHVTNEPFQSDDYCTCSAVRFEQVLIELKEDGVSFITVDRLLDLLKKKSTEKFVVVTFDDGTEDLFLIAYPILKRMQIPFIVYIVIDFINRNGYMSDSQLTILNNDPLCTIGSHTISHPVLRYSKNALNEIVESKKLLECKFGKPIDHFAYPYGKFVAVSLKNIRMARKAGYKSAMGTIETKVKKYHRNFKWYLPRIIVK